MGVVESKPRVSNMIARVKNLLLRPSETWEVIAGEPASVPGLYWTWAIPLVAIPVICGLAGMLAFERSAFDPFSQLMFGRSAEDAPLLSLVLSAAAAGAIGYVLSLTGVYVLALIIDALAPAFSGTSKFIQAFKLSAYSATPTWIAGVFGIIPALEVLGYAGALYSLILLYKGLPKLMRTSPEKALPYVGGILVVCVVLGVILGVALVMVVSLTSI